MDVYLGNFIGCVRPLFSQRGQLFPNLSRFSLGALGRAAIRTTTRPDTSRDADTKF